MLSGSSGLVRGFWQFSISSHVGNPKYLQLGLLGSASRLQSQALEGRAGGGYQASFLLLSHWPLPFSSSAAPAGPSAPPWTCVPAASPAGFRVLVVRGERAGGWEGRRRLILSVWRPGHLLVWEASQASSSSQAEILRCYTLYLQRTWSISIVGVLVSLGVKERTPLCP